MGWACVKTGLMKCFIIKTLSNACSHQHHQRRTFADVTIKYVRDRGLDHAVTREKHLRPVLNIKNLIKSEPSKSLPLSILNHNRDSLQIPFRPIDFTHQYPTFFEEFFPGGVNIHPHIKLTTEALDLDAEEMLLYQSDTYKQQAADRLLRLLMISRINKMPLSIIERLKWDLGLPQDYLKSIVPEFPDYFRVMDGKDSASRSRSMGMLELVCWIGELGISAIEKKEMSTEIGYSKGMAIRFPMKFSKGFEMDKNFKKWVDEWQKLPYISPYENATHLLPKGDESDKWAVGVLHELLHIFVPKKTDRENILCIGDYLGLRSMFKRALLHHPGIFYLSSKAGNCTVVLREAYIRGVLNQSDPLTSLRSRYLHLMHSVKEDHKNNVRSSLGRMEGSLSESEIQDDNDGSDDMEDDFDNDNEEDECKSKNDSYRIVANGSTKRKRETCLDAKRPSTSSVRGRLAGKNKKKLEHRTA